MSKILIAYGTRFGATEKTSEELSRNLTEKGHNVQVINLKKQKPPDPSSYDTILVGSSIMMGNWMEESKKYLTNEFNGKNIALFVSAGGTMSENFRKDPDEMYKAEKMFLNDISKEYGIEPFSTRIFGGWIKKLGIEVMNTWNKDDPENWSQEIHQYLSEES